MYHAGEHASVGSSQLCRAVIAAAAPLGALALEEIAASLTNQGYVTAIRTALALGAASPQHLSTLRHRFIVVQHAGAPGECVIVDPAFRSQFEVAGLAPTGRYTSQLVPLLPHLFVGMLSTLASIVQLMDSALGEEARAMGLELPPWRSAGAMLSKWMPKRYSDQVFVPTPVSLHPVLLAACSHNQERQWTSTAANTNTGGAGGCDGSTTSSASGSPPSPRAIQVWEDSASESGVSCCESCTSSPSSNRCQAATPVTQGYVRSVVSPAVGRCNPQQTVFGFAVSPGGTACSNSGAASPTSPFFARRTARAASALSQQLARESARARIAMPYVEKAAQQQQWEQQLFPRQARRVVCLSTVGAKHVAASVGAVL